MDPQMTVFKYIGTTEDNVVCLNRLGNPAVVKGQLNFLACWFLLLFPWPDSFYSPDLSVVHE